MTSAPCCEFTVTFTGKRNLSVLREPLFRVECVVHGDLTKGARCPDGYETDDPNLYIRLHLKQSIG